MNVFPQRYDKLDLNKSELALIKTLEAQMMSDTFFLVNINPAGIEKVHAFISNRGIVFIETLAINDIKIIPTTKKALRQMLYKKSAIIYKRLSQHKKLKIKDGDNYYLKFPFTYKFFLREIRFKELMNSKILEEDKKFIIEYCIFKDSKPQNSKKQLPLFDKLLGTNDLIELLYNKVEHPFSADWNGFTEEDINNVLQMIAPEYTIPKMESEDVRVEEKQAQNKFKEKEYEIDSNDINVSVLRLDNDQINIINNIKKGNQLILASAGSGKSVILLSKAFKVANIHPDQNFLLTCYNRNLANYYNWKIAVAGFRERNVKCMTFHKLLQELLRESGIGFSENDHDENFEKVRKMLNERTIAPQYYGVFIDEIQVFKPEWYELCYDLLKHPVGDDYFLIICGDISQNINKNIKKGQAPWQGNKRLPKYVGKSLRVTKNYRNSKQINDFVHRFTNQSKQYFKKFEIELDNQNDIFLMGEAIRNSKEPKVLVSNRNKVVTDIVEEIKRLNTEEEVQLSDIAVLFPVRKFDPFKYYFFYWLENKLKEECIDYSKLINDKWQVGVRYGERIGVTLSTIEASLGLDFKAVILSGLLPMGAYYQCKSKKIEQIQTQKNNEEIKQDFVENINKIYTACTRARDYLTILLEEGQDKSLYSKIILESIRR